MLWVVYLNNGRHFNSFSTMLRCLYVCEYFALHFDMCLFVFVVIFT